MRSDKFLSQGVISLEDINYTAPFSLKGHGAVNKSIFSVISPGPGIHSFWWQWEALCLETPGFELCLNKKTNKRKRVICANLQIFAKNSLTWQYLGDLISRAVSVMRSPWGLTWAPRPRWGPASLSWWPRSCHSLGPSPCKLSRKLLRIKRVSIYLVIQ